MALLQRTRILPNQRIDLPDYNNIEDFICADFKAIHKNIWTGNNFVFSGFKATGTGTTDLAIELAGSSAVIGEDSGVVYIGAPSLAALSTSALTPSSTNFIEIFIEQDTGGADSRAFWDQTAAGGAGGEFSQIIDTFIFLKATFAINTSNFTGDADKLPLCEVDVNVSGVITAIRDSRNMFWRLGRRGDATFNFPWSSRVEPANTAFIGADKDIGTFKEWTDAIMSSIKEIKGSTYWFEAVPITLPGTFVNAALSTIAPVTSGARIEWDGSNLRITDDNLTPATADRVAAIRALNDIANIYLTRQDDGKEVVTITLDAVADAGILTLDANGNSVAINWNDNTAAIQSTWNGSGAAAATIAGSVAEQKITITFNTAANQVDVFKNTTTLTKNTVAVIETISIKQGQASDNSIPINDGEALWVELPDPLADQDYTAVGILQSNYRVSARGSVPLNDTTYWICYREGTKLILRDTGELESGEVQQFGDQFSQALKTYIGATDESDDSPNYDSADIVTQGGPLNKAIGELDAAVSENISDNNQDRNLKLVGGGIWAWDSGTGNLSFTTDAYIQIPGISNVRNTIQQSSQSPINLASDGDVAYVTVNRTTGGATNLTVSTSAIASLTPGKDTAIIARRIGTEVIVGTHSFNLINGESKELDSGLSIQNRAFIGNSITEATSQPTYSSDIRGTASENLETRIGNLTDAAGDYQEDRSTFMRSDSEITWTGTQITFSSDIVIEILNTKSGVSSQHTILSSNSPVSLNNQESAWVLIDRTQTIENLTVNLSDSTAIPAQTQANKDVIVLFRRMDANGFAYLHLPFMKQLLEPSQKVRLGASGGITVTPFSMLDNQVSAANVTGIVVPSTANAFKAEISIKRQQTAAGFELADFYTNLGTAFDGTVNIVLAQSNDDTLVGGGFTTLNGNTRNRLVRLNSDGTEDTAFYANLGTGFNGTIFAAAQQSSDSKLLLGGGFTTLGANTRNYLVRLNLDGTEDSAFYTNLGTGFNGNLDTIAIQSDGKILTCGSFTTLNGNTRNHLVRLNSDGTEDTAFYTNLGTGFSTHPTEISVQTDGKIVVGGTFNTLNGNIRNRLVRLNSDGTEDTVFYTNLGTGFNGGVQAVKVQTDGKIVVTGDFTDLNGNARSRIVRLNSDGTEDTAFYTNLGTGINAAATNIYEQNTGKLIISGSFSTINGNSRVSLARLNSDGTEDSTFYTNLGTSFNAAVNSVAELSDGSLVVGGSYTLFNSNIRNRLVQLYGDIDLIEQRTLRGIYRSSPNQWDLGAEVFLGDDTGVNFSMTSSGQLQYTSTDLPGTVTDFTAKFAIFKL